MSIEKDTNISKFEQEEISKLSLEVKSLASLANMYAVNNELPDEIFFAITELKDKTAKLDNIINK